MLPKWYTIAVALCLVMMLSLVASAHAGGRKVKLCDVSGSPCIVVTMPAPGKSKWIQGYKVCHPTKTRKC